VNEIVIVLPPGQEGPAPPTAKPARVVTGGARRQDSVARGFAAVSETADVVLVHDAARPFVAAALIDRTIEAATEDGAAIAAIPVHDTVKQARRAGDRLYVDATLPREGIFLAQTPQAFRREVLAAAVAASGQAADASDEAKLVEAAGGAVRLVDGDPANVKITTPADLARAQAGGEARESGPPLASASAMRVGTGYDLHRLVEGRALKLGGVAIAFERGLAGHSDADVVCHAVTDALLGAANAGDIGRLFPDTDPRWKDADSLQLLAEAWSRVAAAGWRIVNVDIVVVAERPKIGPHAEAIRASLAGALRVSPDAIAIKGKTNEGVDAVGRGEAIAVHAVALITR
jgi:2-C-methyl-D-erythritol 4-phosphate cytidylyltransferase/2-C-methyl-D-erythritol 2,4-cyclodiphosphate synthase